MKLDPDQLARERRIDEASVDVEVVWEERAQAEQAVVDAEVAAAAAIERLLAEKLAVKDVVQLTGLDQATIRRLRQLDTDDGEGEGDVGDEGGGGSRGKGATAEVA